MKQLRALARQSTPAGVLSLKLQRPESAIRYGLGDSLTVIAKHASQARLVEGFAMQAPQERQTVTRVMEWLNGVKPI